MMYKACKIPGMNPRIVKIIFKNNGLVQPTSRKTPNGGKMIAAMILMISEQVKAIL